MHCWCTVTFVHSLIDPRGVLDKAQLDEEAAIERGYGTISSAAIPKVSTILVSTVQQISQIKSHTYFEYKPNTDSNFMYMIYMYVAP